MNYLVRMLQRVVMVGVVCAGWVACGPTGVGRREQNVVAASAVADGEEIRFSVVEIRADGLTGPPDGLRAVFYEFCVPDSVVCREEVSRIDRHARFSRSPGRVGCGAGELLVISDTHQENWRGVLGELAALPYVREIRRADFE